MDLSAVTPDLRAATARLPRPDPSRPLVLRGIRLATRVMPAVSVPGVTAEVVVADGRRVRVHRPARRLRPGALLWIHGGGLLFGSPKQDEALAAGTAAELGIVVIAASYRFAPEHPFPAAIEDLRSTWHWLRREALGLDIDPGGLAIGGESAGGGLAASLAQALHDEGGLQPIAQWLFAPMLDDRTAARTDLDALDHFVWNNTTNRFAWRAYLGREPGAAVLPPYAAAARRTDFSGLPPAFIAVGDIELFAGEDRDYARRLRAAGARTELDVVPGAPHGFENWARDSEPARALLSRARLWLSTAFDDARS